MTIRKIYFWGMALFWIFWSAIIYTNNLVYGKPQPTTKLSISGKVTDQNGLPIANAYVYALYPPVNFLGYTETNGNGNYQLQIEHLIGCQVKVRYQGMDFASKTLFLEKEKKVNMNFELPIVTNPDFTLLARRSLETKITLAMGKHKSFIGEVWGPKRIEVKKKFQLRFFVYDHPETYASEMHMKGVGISLIAMHENVELERIDGKLGKLGKLFINNQEYTPPTEDERIRQFILEGMGMAILTSAQPAFHLVEFATKAGILKQYKRIDHGDPPDQLDNLDPEYLAISFPWEVLFVRGGSSQPVRIDFYPTIEKAGKHTFYAYSKFMYKFRNRIPESVAGVWLEFDIKAKGKNETVPVVDMVLIQSGEFTMGRSSTERGLSKVDMPAHQVFLDNFYIDKFPVTNEMFKKFIDSTGYVTEAEKNGYGWVFQIEKSSGQMFDKVRGAKWDAPEGPGSTISLRMKHPVVQVTYNDAIAYANWTGKRLPTEAEWEKAARGNTEGTKYPWGNSRDISKANCYESGINRTAPVDKYPPNKLGIYDIIGNVSEWCQDWYDDNYYNISPTRNPKGPNSGTRRVIRSSGWFYPLFVTPITFRAGQNPNESSNTTGFRCAKDNNK